MRRRGSQRPGRHRLGAPGLRHCLEYQAVAAALEEYRRTWWTAILVPTAKHSLAGLRRRAAAAAVERSWVPRMMERPGVLGV